MIWTLDFFFLSMAAGCAVAAIQVKDLLSAVLILDLYTLLLAPVWAQMAAVDVSFTAVAVGPGVMTVFFIAILFKTGRRSKD